MLQVKQDPRLGSVLGGVHEHRPLAKRVAMAFQHEINRGVEERMAGRNEGGRRFAFESHVAFVEGDALVGVQHRGASSNNAIMQADFSRHATNLESPWFTLEKLAAEHLKRFIEERPDIVRLQFASLGTVHLVANLAHTRSREGFMYQITVFNQAAQMLHVEFGINHLVEPRFDLRPVALANGFDQQVAEGTVFEHFAEHIKDSATQGFALLGELFQKAMKDVTLARFNRDKIPQMAAFGLTDTVDAPEALFDAVGIPGKVVIHHEMRAAMEVDAFAGSVGSNQNQNFGVLLECFLNLTTTFARCLAVDGDDVIRVA